jgi:group I intron endonuclease
MAERKGVIYKITCTVTNKSYIGQAKTHKLKNGKPYKYGSAGRWSDHKSSSKKHGSPFAKAIQQHGAEAFIVSDIEVVNEDQLDAREAYWINVENTLQPNGYNVMEHSRNKHNRVSTLHTQYVGNVSVAEIHTVRADGERSFVYLYLIMKDGTSKRLTFGQGHHDTFESAVLKATEFANHLNCEIKDFTDKTYSQQTRTLYDLSGAIKEITITTASDLVAVYILTSTMTKRKECLRVCFGGKTVTKQDAYKNAMDYIKTLPVSSETKLDDKLKTNYNYCSQQAAAS